MLWRASRPLVPVERAEVLNEPRQRASVYAFNHLLPGRAAVYGAKEYIRAVIHAHIKNIQIKGTPPSHRNRSLAISKNTEGTELIRTVQGLVG